MNNSEKYFINLINKYINSSQDEENLKNVYDVPYESVDVERLSELIKIHRISALIYTVIDKNIIDADLNDRLQRGFFTGIARYHNRNKVYFKMLELFEENGIDSIVVKGCFINRFYPQPEVRSMSDIDILIRSTDTDKVKTLLCKSDFEYCPEDSEENVNAFKCHGVNIEVHNGLVSEGCVINGYDFKEYFSDPFEHIEKSGIELTGGVSEHVYYLEDTYNLIYMIFHVAKHFYHSGCGVRMIMDFPFFINNANIDYDRFISDLKMTKLYDFSVALFSICREWFGMESKTGSAEVNEEVMDFIINGGVYGFYKRNTAANKIEYMSNGDGKESSYSKGVLKWAFPSPKKMRDYSVWYRNKPAILLPVAYAERMVRNIKARGGLVKVVKNIAVGKKDLNEKDIILKSVGLK